MQKQLLPDKDIGYIIGHLYKYYTSYDLTNDLRIRRTDKSHRWKKYYIGYRTQKVVKDGVPCIYIIYISRKRFDKSMLHACNENGKLRRRVRDKNISKLKGCTTFMSSVRTHMIAAGYTEYDNYDDKGNRLLFRLLPIRVYADLYKYRNGFNEMDVLGRYDRNVRGLLGTYLVHRKIQHKGRIKYLLRPIEFGSIPREAQAMTLRELVLYGYYLLGMSNMVHLSALTTYWNDYNRKLYLPPEHGFQADTRCTWMEFLARKRKAQRRANRCKQKGKGEP